MAYNPSIDDEEPPKQDIDIQALSDQDELENLRDIRSEVGEAGLTDDQMEFIAQYEVDPQRAQMEFGANLAEFIPDDDLNRIGSDATEAFDEDYESRSDWYEREVKGIRMLGVTTKTDGGAKFDGASKAVHPMLAEACVQFQARTVSEVWPAHGPVKTIDIGESSDEKDQQANRVSSYMNYLLNDVMPGAYEAEDMAYLRLPMSGSVFKKIYHDKAYGHMDDFVSATDFVVPYNAVDLRTAPRYTHVLFLFPNEVKRYQLLGTYLDIELPDPDEDHLDRIFYKEVKDSEGQTLFTREKDHRHTFLEQHVYLDIPGYEHENPEGKKTGFKLPYVITIDYDSQKVVSVRRNWKENDPLFMKREWFVHKKFTPGFGFYGYGFFHWIGSLTTAAAGSLRALLDAAQFSNLPAGYRSKEGRGLGSEGPLAPGEWRETDLQADEIDKAFFPAPYKEPSMTLFNLMGHLEELGRRFASTTDVLTGSETGNVPVGTTLARIDQGQKIFNSIHKRIYRANRLEYKLLHDQIAEHMPQEGYPFSYAGVSQEIAHKDFDSRIDVFPVADPEVATSTQRIIQSQFLMEISGTRPELYNMRQVHRRALSAVRIQDIDQVLRKEEKIPRRDPISENMGLLTNEPLKVFPDQDHEAHRVVHDSFIAGLPQEKQSELEAPMAAHLAEHLAWQYYIQMTSVMGAEIPQEVLIGDEEMPPQVEMELSLMAAQATQLLPPRPSPEEMEAQAKAASIQAEDQAKTQAAASDINRKDAMVQAEIDRKQAIADAEIRRGDEAAAAKSNTERQASIAKASTERLNTVSTISRAEDESKARVDNLTKESEQRVKQAEEEAEQEASRERQGMEITAKQAEQSIEIAGKQAETATVQAEVDKGESDEAVLKKLEELSDDIDELKKVEPAAPVPPPVINLTIDNKGGVKKTITPKYSKDGKIESLTTAEIEPGKKPN